MSSIGPGGNNPGPVGSGGGGPKKPKDGMAQGNNGNANGNKGNNGGGSLRYGAYGGYKGVARKKAAGFVDADIRRLKRDTHSGVKQERRQFRRERGDIKHVARETGQQLHQLRHNSAQAYSDAASQSAAAQQALSQQISQNSGAVQGGANSELSRLGLSGSDATAQMGADAANSQNIAAQGGANNAANLGLASANSKALSNLMIGSNKGERFSQLGISRNARDENVSQLRDALHQAQAGRGDSVKALLDQMAQTGWQQYMGQAQLGLQRQSMKQNGGSGSYNPYANYGSNTPYSAQNYQSTYGYGYSSPGGGSNNGGSSGGGSANAAKLALYQNLMNTQP
jgi:hypothetical protein